jgi:hypothetical protein
LRDVEKIIIFTGEGDGPRRAITDFCSQQQYAAIKVIAVTFAYGKFSAPADTRPPEISAEDRNFLESKGVKIVRAHLPFDPIAAQFTHHGILGQDLGLIGNALSIFGGSMNLCVQAVIMACDAGELLLGEHVISMTSDTAILVRSAPTCNFLTDFIIRELICKPIRLTIGKKEPRLDFDQPVTIEGDAVPQLEGPSLED